MTDSYQALFNDYIFIGGANCVIDAVKNEDLQIILDLRVESNEGVWHEDDRARWVHIPLVDKVEGQEDLLQEAINVVVNAYQQKQKVLIH